MLTILICKLLRFLGGLLGRGSSLPGAVALKLDKNILSKLTLPEKSLAISGSNGKTSVTELVRAAAEAAGLRAVCNSYGSNQIEGVATALLAASDLRGRVRADALILESDERFCQYTFKHFAPKYILITNLYRDQLTRNGHSGFVLVELRKGLRQESTLILNADDPVSASLGEGRDAIYYGIETKELDERPDLTHAYDDGARCPLCKAPLHYSRRIVSHLGEYECAACGYKRKPLEHAVSGFDGESFILDGEYRVRPQIANSMFAYNIAAAFSAATEALDIAPETAAAALDGHALANGRVRSFSINGHQGLFLLSKHENSMAYNGALETIKKSEAEEITVVLIADLLSRKYVANDMSWLWDIDFELLADERVKRVFCGGLFAWDIALRLEFAGVPGERLTVRQNLDELMDELYSGAAGQVYALTCFTDQNKFLGRLKEGAR
ncbi:MAG: MurT ligase domain-containing protein [Oscillospiraceae bacterium]|nr:MurT ligase domain-containing protein [Oscillospiraceae bacterium]